MIPELDQRKAFWTQPERDEILLDSVNAVMSEKTFNMLIEYSRSNPSGVYPGKMWKSTPRGNSNIWYLNWYALDERDATFCVIHRRRIRIMDWQKLMGLD